MGHDDIAQRDLAAGQPARRLLAHVYTASGAVRTQGPHPTYNRYNTEQAEPEPWSLQIEACFSYVID
jgi:hypothetical protein